MNPQGINDLIRIELDKTKDELQIARAAIHSAITVLAGDGNEKIKNTRASLILSNARDGRFVVTPTGPDLAEENKRLQAEIDRLNMVLAYQPEEGSKDRHIRTQAVEIASLRNRLKLLQMGQQVPQEWHDDPPEQGRFDLP